MQDRGVRFGAPDGEGRARMANPSEEEREAMRAAIQAGGDVPAGASVPGGAARQYRMVIRPLATMLEERAAKA